MLGSDQRQGVVTALLSTASTASTADYAGSSTYEGSAAISLI
jgi:hypothetical protein